MAFQRTLLAAGLATALVTGCTATATGSVTPGTGASTTPSAQPSATASAPATGAPAAPSDAAPGSAKLTVDGVDIPLVGPLTASAQGVPGVFISRIVLATGGVASAAGASAKITIDPKSTGTSRLEPGFTEANSTHTVEINFVHPKHGSANYTSGRIAFDHKSWTVTSTGGRIKGTATYDGKPWVGSDVKGDQKEPITLTFDAPYPAAAGAPGS